MFKKKYPLQIGERPFGCDFCDKTFIKMANKVEHERTHTGEKPYGCSFCQKKFSNKRFAKDHERVHTEEKPFSCDKCGKSYTHCSSLHNHKKVCKVNDFLPSKSTNLSNSFCLEAIILGVLR